MFINKISARRDIRSHKELSHVRSLDGILDPDLFHPSARGIQSRLPELFRIHLSQSLIALQGKVGLVCPAIPGQGIIIVQILSFSPLWHDLVERGHGNIHMPLIDQLGHKAVKQGQEQGRNMGSVHVGIRHDDDLIVAELCDIKIIAVSLGKTAAEGIDHGLDLGIGKDLVNAGLFHVQDLAADGQDGLKHTVAGHLGTAAGRISLDDKDLTFGGIFARAVGKLAVGIKGEFLLGEHVGLGLLFRFADLSGFFGTADHGLEGFKIAVKKVHDLLTRHLGNRLGGVLVVELGLGLSLKPGSGMLDGNNRCHAVADIRPGEVCVLVLEDSQTPGIGINDLCKGRLKAGQMCAALCIVDIVAESQHIFVEFIDILQSNLDLDSLRGTAEADDIRNCFLFAVECTNKAGDPIRLVINDLLRLFPAKISVNNSEAGIQIGRLVEAALDILLFKTGLFKNLGIRQEVDLSTAPLRLSDHGQQSVLEFLSGLAPGIFVPVDTAVSCDRYSHSFREGIDDAGSYTVQSAARLIGIVVKFSSCMKCGKDHPLGADAFFMHSDRDAAPVVFHRTGSVRLQHHRDRIAISRQMLIDRVVNDLVDQVIEAARRHTADIHARPCAHSFKAFQHPDAIGPVLFFMICHILYCLLINAGSSKR